MIFTETQCRHKKFITKKRCKASLEILRTVSFKKCRFFIKEVHLPGPEEVGGEGGAFANPNLQHLCVSVRMSKGWQNRIFGALEQSHSVLFQAFLLSK